MRFLVDECTGPKVAQWLINAGHDVVSVHTSMRGSADDSILRRALREERVLVTNDKDFGEKIFREKQPHMGVIFLRLDDERTSTKISVINKLLSVYSEKIGDAFVVASETYVRFR